MIQPFLAYFRKNTDPSRLYTIPIPSRDYPITDILPHNSYAYFICDIDVIQEDDMLIPLSAPENCSPKTYWGGTLYPMELAMEAYADDEEMLEFLASWDSKYIISYDKAFFPFYEEDIHISVNPNL